MYLTNRFFSVVFSFVLLGTISHSHAQQRGNPRLFGILPAVTLAQLEEVQAAMKLNDDQKKAVKDLQHKLDKDRRELFQDASGDFDKFGKGIAKLYVGSFKELNSTLEKPQVSRIREIYMQVNEAMVLTDEPMQAMLKISKKQKTKLQDVIRKSREEMFASFQDFQDMSQEERIEAGNKLVEIRDKNLLAVLNSEQKAAFAKAKGKEIKIDLTKLPFPGR